MVDHVVREARRSEREGLVPGSSTAVRCWPSGSGSGSRSPRTRGGRFDLRVEVAGPVAGAGRRRRPRRPGRRAARQRLQPHPRRRRGRRSCWRRARRRGAAGGRGRRTRPPPTGSTCATAATSGAGSTGLGLSIADKTATESGGGLSVGVSPVGGARVGVELGRRADQRVIRPAPPAAVHAGRDHEPVLAGRVGRGRAPGRDRPRRRR